MNVKKFITFEGIDGSGKTTILKLVYKKLKSEGFDVISTFEPTNSYIGKYVQKCIENNYDPYLTSFTFIADRIDHSKKINKWLNENKIVLCDRYSDSTLAYQSVQLEKLIENPIKWLKEISDRNIIIPDRTFLFIIDPELSIQRIKNREKIISFEKVSFLKKVDKYYNKLANSDRYIKIDATKSIEELVRFCYKDILSLRE
ncbi:dTMP kinase [Thermoplasmatota archaeon]